MTRLEFEKAPVKPHPIDGMNYKPDAQPDCKTCAGMGIIDIGNEWGCVLSICPTCWRTK